MLNSDTNDFLLQSGRSNESPDVKPESEKYVRFV